MAVLERFCRLRDSRQKDEEGSSVVREKCDMEKYEKDVWDVVGVDRQCVWDTLDVP